jgi:hypothetical protein
MKRPVLFIAVFLALGGTLPARQGADTEAALGTVLRQGADFFYGRIPEGRKIAVFDLKSGDPKDGEAFAEKLRGIFSNEGRLVCVERGQMLSLIHREQDYSLSMKVDEQAEILMGHELGAQVILSGTLVKTDYGFLVTINAIDTETAARLGQYEGRIEISFSEKAKTYYRENGFLFVGLRAGPGFGTYTPAAEALPASYAGGKTAINTTKIAFDFALQVSLAPVKFFAIQAEAMLLSDSFKVAYTPPMRDTETVREIKYLSLAVPVLGKFMFKPEIGNLTLLLQGYGGVYFTIPLTPMEASGSAGSFSGRFTVPLGFTGGGGAGIKLGPGFIFLDARYMADGGDTEVSGQGRINRRRRLSVTAGYEIKLF